MVNSFQDGNAVNYAKSFSSISFVFTPSASAKNKIDWTAWDKTQEQQCFEKIINHFSNNSRVVLTFDSYTPTYNSNISQVETAYHLTLPVAGGVVMKFNGQVQYTLTQVSGLWYINQWVDISVNVSDSTWSDLKGIAYSQW
jgi:hypothetical protein